jgi:hypothetical protein
MEQLDTWSTYRLTPSPTNGYPKRYKNGTKIRVPFIIRTPTAIPPRPRGITRCYNPWYNPLLQLLYYNMCIDAWIMFTTGHKLRVHRRLVINQGLSQGLSQGFSQGLSQGLGILLVSQGLSQG